MKLEDVEKIIKMFEKSTVSSIDLEIDNIKIKLEKPTQVVTNVIPNTSSVVLTSNDEEIASDDYEYVTAPLVGTFHQAPFVDAKPFVSVGERVTKGQKLCIIEAMKVMNEITSPCDGIVKEILVKEELLEPARKWELKPLPSIQPLMRVLFIVSLPQKPIVLVDHQALILT